MSRNNLLFERAKKVLPGGNTRTTLFVPPAAPYAAWGDGAYITDEDGHVVIDCNNNYTALIHGHRFGPSIEAAHQVMEYGTAFGLPTRSEIELGEMLAERLPHLDQWRFCNSGTEAVMQAIRIARAATGRDLLLRFEGSYHGTSDAVVDSMAPGLPKTIQQSVITAPVGDFKRTQELFDNFEGQIAAVLIDLMPNRAGLQPSDPRFVMELEKMTRSAGALLIVDEVITFRSEYGGLQSRYNLQPDLTTLGKIIGGGFPAGAVGGRADVMSVTDPHFSDSLGWGGTFSANPVTMAAGRAALAAYDRDAISRLNKMGDGLRERLRKTGIECSGSGSLIRLFPEDLTAFWWAAYHKGVLLGTNALVALSTVMNETDVELIESRLVEAWEGYGG